ncbi:MAG: hypothetical protein KGI38_12265, partial [Thaumarchaeota archaeon]|nr:hypothetical protein [Nitrososphaerota archaeon]
QAVADAIDRHDFFGAKYGLEEFAAKDASGETIKRLSKEVEELKTRLKEEEERNADLQASVNLGLPHQNRKGTGAHYASKIKKLGPARAEALSVLIEYGAKDYATGLTTDQVAQHAREGREWRHVPYPEDLAHSLGGRLSELQGLKLVRSETNAVELKDDAEQKFRTMGGERWFLTPAGQSIETPAEDMDPHEILLSYEAKPKP